MSIAMNLVELRKLVQTSELGNGGTEIPPIVNRIEVLNSGFQF